VSNKLSELNAIQRNLERNIVACVRIAAMPGSSKSLLTATLDKACTCVARILIEKAKITSKEDSEQ
jgi:hypothetical protein